MSDETGRRVTIVARTRRITMTFIVAASLPALASAQVARHSAATSCAPRGAAHGPAFVFGNEAGNLKRGVTTLWADGSVQVASGRRTAPDAGISDSVAALARFARESSFWTTKAPRITRPTRNPDMAREYVEAHLQCGARHSLYPADAEPPAFHELITRLAAVTELARRR